MEETVFTAYIGDTDPQEWFQSGEGKAVLMPVLFKVSEEVIEDKIEEKHAARVEAQIRGKMKAFDFFVTFNAVDDTLNKIMKWALQEEEYEMCSKIKKLQGKINEENYF
jgi:hypothetical protein